MSGAEPWDNAACWNPHMDGGLLVLGGARACVSGVRVEPSSHDVHPCTAGGGGCTAAEARSAFPAGKGWQDLAGPGRNAGSALLLPEPLSGAGREMSLLQ